MTALSCRHKPMGAPMTTEEKISKVNEILSRPEMAEWITDPVATLDVAKDIIDALAPRVFANGQDIPPRTVVMSADGSIHGHPEEDQGCYDEGFGAHLGTLVEVMGPDEWSEHASRVGGA